jgi:hypothetical protein
MRAIINTAGNLNLAKPLVVLNVRRWQNMSLVENTGAAPERLCCVTVLLRVSAGVWVLLKRYETP